ncbi:heterogeneous nuclear ribonucleoprotein C-like 2 [Petaurus breviceps papuanus]|uniref:heterogeneous nuclear ribonucleoprotein C-like 2 n=1 Tax=Petaurus breviceps papuanus TaxID=3040969 RepID=UPI0036D79F0F
MFFLENKGLVGCPRGAPPGGLGFSGVGTEEAGTWSVPWLGLGGQDTLHPNTETLSRDLAKGFGTIESDKKDCAWPSLNKAAKASGEGDQASQAPKKVSFQGASQAEQPITGDPSSEIPEGHEMEKGNSEGKGKGASGAKGGQRGPNPKLFEGKDEDSQGIRRDLEKIEQKLDILLENTNQFGKEPKAPLLAVAKEEEKLLPQLQPEPQSAPVVLPVMQQQVPPQQAPPQQQQQQQQQGGKGKKKAKSGAKSA